MHKSDAKERLVKKGLAYLNENLPWQIREKVSKDNLLEILSCLSNWIYDEKMSRYYEIARGLQKKLNKSELEVELGNSNSINADDFYEDLKQKK